MPGKYCSFPNCYSNSTPKYDGVHFFQIPTRKTEFPDYVGWKTQIVEVLSKYRTIGAPEKSKIEAGKMYICSKHFSEEDVEFTEMGRWKVKFGALPRENLPSKSHEKKVEPRRHINIVKDICIASSSSSEPKQTYKSYDHFEKSLFSLRFKGWNLIKGDKKCYFKTLEKCSIPYIDVMVREDLEFTVCVYGWTLPNKNFIYERHNRSIKFITISKLLAEIMSYNFCQGVSSSSDETLEHFIPLECNEELTDGSPINSKKLFRSRICSILLDTVERCDSCSSLEKKINKQNERKVKNINIPAKKNAPLSKTHPNKVVLALKSERKEFKEKLEKMKKEIGTKGVDLSNDSLLNSDFFNIMENNCNATPFIKLFWTEQKKLAKGNPNAIRYHPMLIRFCISLAAKSASAYDELRSSGILTLPSRRTLRDYTNFIKPKVGFNTQVTEALVKESSKLVGYQRYMCLSFDEIKIEENLVFDKYTGNLVGFVDLGSDTLNSTHENSNKLATHVMVFFLRSVAGGFKFSFAYFGTDGMNGYQIMSLLWDAVSILEMIDLPVLCATSDGASANRKLYRNHWLLSNSLSDITYRTVNLFSLDSRYLYFFADVPHLIKTSRNCLYHSGPGKSRYMQNKTGFLEWNHIKTVMMDDLKRGTKLVPKLTINHIELTPYSKMKVSYASQVLSSSVANILCVYYPSYKATAEYCDLMNKFFDCLNARHTEEHKNKLNPFLAPYTSIDDFRFDWLENTFLRYFAEWKEFLNSNKNLTATDKEKMFISKQTYEGLIITVRSMIEMTRFLLSKGMRYFLPVNVNQDCTDEHFGHHRSCGRRNANPDLHLFGYQENKLRIQKFVTNVKGNTSGRHSKKAKTPWNEVNDEPLPKRASGSGLF